MEEIGIIGAGRMGIGLATALLAAGMGWRVRLVDVKERAAGRENAALQRAGQEITSNIGLLGELGRLPGEAERLVEHLSLGREPGRDLAGCGFIFEALPERLEIKQHHLTKLEGLFEEGCIIASTTSTFDLAALSGAMSRPERLIITHWLNPAFLIPLVEVARGETTADETVEQTRRLLEAAGRVPVILKDSPGFIVPRIQTAAMNEAVRILEEGVASVEEIDTAVKAGFGFRLAVLGLIEFIDLGGVDILYYAGQFLQQRLKQPHFGAPGSVAEKMEKGEVGPRSGRGYYDYSGVDIAAMFRRRYRGFTELLDLIRGSPSLDLRGGVRSD